MKTLRNAIIPIALFMVTRLWSMDASGIPCDCWLRILGLLELHHISQVSLVSRELYQVTYLDALWLTLAHRDFGDKALKFKTDNENIKNVYMHYPQRLCQHVKNIDNWSHIEIKNIYDNVSFPNKELYIIQRHLIKALEIKVMLWASSQVNDGKTLFCSLVAYHKIFLSAAMHLLYIYGGENEALEYATRATVAAVNGKAAYDATGDVWWGARIEAKKIIELEHSNCEYCYLSLEFNNVFLIAHLSQDEYFKFFKLAFNAAVDRFDAEQNFNLSSKEVLENWGRLIWYNPDRPELSHDLLIQNFKRVAEILAEMIYKEED